MNAFVDFFKQCLFSARQELAFRHCVSELFLAQEDKTQLITLQNHLHSEYSTPHIQCPNYGQTLALPPVRFPAKVTFHFYSCGIKMIQTQTLEKITNVNCCQFYFFISPNKENKI